MDRFPVLRRKARQQASTLSGGEQKMLEIARGLMLEPQLMLIDEPSIGLSPILVEELFALIRDMRTRGVTVLMIEQNAKRALEQSDYRDRARTRLHPHSGSRRRKFSPIRASGSCFSAADWNRRRPHRVVEARSG